MSAPFEYNPTVLGQQIQMVTQASMQLEDIRSRALGLLSATKEFWDAEGSTAYEDAQLVINNGIDEGKEVLRNQAHTTDHSHQNSMSTDAAAAQAISAF